MNINSTRPCLYHKRITTSKPNSKVYSVSKFYNFINGEGTEVAASNYPILADTWTGGSEYYTFYSGGGVGTKVVVNTHVYLHADGKQKVFTNTTSPASNAVDGQIYFSPKNNGWAIISSAASTINPAPNNSNPTLAINNVFYIFNGTYINPAPYSGNNGAIPTLAANGKYYSIRSDGYNNGIWNSGGLPQLGPEGKYHIYNADGTRSSADSLTKVRYCADGLWRIIASDGTGSFIAASNTPVNNIVYGDAVNYYTFQANGITNIVNLNDIYVVGGVEKIFSSTSTPAALTLANGYVVQKFGTSEFYTITNGTKTAFSGNYPKPVVKYSNPLGLQQHLVSVNNVTSLAPQSAYVPVLCQDGFYKFFTTTDGFGNIWPGTSGASTYMGGAGSEWAVKINDGTYQIFILPNALNSVNRYGVPTPVTLGNVAYKLFRPPTLSHTTPNANFNFDNKFYTFSGASTAVATTDYNVYLFHDGLHYSVLGTAKTLADSISNELAFKMSDGNYYTFVAGGSKTLVEIGKAYRLYQADSSKYYYFTTTSTPVLADSSTVVYNRKKDNIWYFFANGVLGVRATSITSPIKDGNDKFYLFDVAGNATLFGSRTFPVKAYDGYYYKFDSDSLGVKQIRVKNTYAPEVDNSSMPMFASGAVLGQHYIVISSTAGSGNFPLQGYYYPTYVSTNAPNLNLTNGFFQTTQNIKIYDFLSSGQPSANSYTYSGQRPLLAFDSLYYQVNNNSTTKNFTNGSLYIAYNEANFALFNNGIKRILGTFSTLNRFTNSEILLPTAAVDAQNNWSFITVSGNNTVHPITTQFIGSPNKNYLAIAYIDPDKLTPLKDIFLSDSSGRITQYIINNFAKPSSYKDANTSAIMMMQDGFYYQNRSTTFAYKVYQPYPEFSYQCSFTPYTSGWYTFLSGIETAPGADPRLRMSSDGLFRYFSQNSGITVPVDVYSTLPILTPTSDTTNKYFYFSRSSPNYNNVDFCYGRTGYYVNNNYPDDADSKNGNFYTYNSGIRNSINSITDYWTINDYVNYNPPVNRYIKIINSLTEFKVSGSASSFTKASANESSSQVVNLYDIANYPIKNFYTNVTCTTISNSIKLTGKYATKAFDGNYYFLNENGSYINGTLANSTIPTPTYYSSTQADNTAANIYYTFSNGVKNLYTTNAITKAVKSYDDKYRTFSATSVGKLVSVANIPFETTDSVGNFKFFNTVGDPTGNIPATNSYTPRTGYNNLYYTFDASSVGTLYNSTKPTFTFDANWKIITNGVGGAVTPNASPNPVLAADGFYYYIASNTAATKLINVNSPLKPLGDSKYYIFDASGVKQNPNAIFTTLPVYIPDQAKYAIFDSGGNYSYPATVATNLVIEAKCATVNTQTISTLFINGTGGSGNFLLSTSCAINLKNTTCYLKTSNGVGSAILSNPYTVGSNSANIPIRAEDGNFYTFTPIANSICSIGTLYNSTVPTISISGATVSSRLITNGIGVNYVSTAVSGAVIFTNTIVCDPLLKVLYTANSTSAISYVDTLGHPVKIYGGGNSYYLGAANGIASSYTSANMTAYAYSASSFSVCTKMPQLSPMDGASYYIGDNLAAATVSRPILTKSGSFDYKWVTIANGIGTSVSSTAPMQADNKLFYTFAAGVATMVANTTTPTQAIDTNWYTFSNGGGTKASDITIPTLCSDGKFRTFATDGTPTLAVVTTVPTLCSDTKFRTFAIAGVGTLVAITSVPTSCSDGKFRTFATAGTGTLVADTVIATLCSDTKFRTFANGGTGTLVADTVIATLCSDTKFRTFATAGVGTLVAITTVPTLCSDTKFRTFATAGVGTLVAITAVPTSCSDGTFRTFAIAGVGTLVADSVTVTSSSYKFPTKAADNKYYTFTNGYGTLANFPVLFNTSATTITPTTFTKYYTNGALNTRTTNSTPVKCVDGKYRLVNSSNQSVFPAINNVGIDCIDDINNPTVLKKYKFAAADGNGVAV
jgi:hypothetical protein